MSVYLKTYIEGFKHCKPLISLDGCHLKGKYGGQLLIVVGIDAIDCIFSIAYDMVETKSIETWRWFIRKLNIENPYSWTWMSNIQKVYLNAYFILVYWNVYFIQYLL